MISVREYNLEKISNKIYRKKKLKKIVGIVLFCILIILFIFFNVIINIKENSGDSHNNKIYAFDIISSSMSPEFDKDDIIFVEKYSSNSQPKINDIITFKYDNKIISHRVIKIEEKDLNKVFYTKGDNNKEIDNFEIQYEDIYGKYVFKIPKIGRIVEFLHEKNRIMKLFVGIIIIFIIIIIKQEKKFKRKKVRKLYNINNYKTDEKKEIWNYKNL